MMYFTAKVIKFTNKYMLSAVLFITGACILVIEIIATRILSQYFGNTIYTVSSVITTILLALSLGYYFGGRFSDKLPYLWIFYEIILISGISVFIMHYLAFSILPFFAYYLPLSGGPLISSVLLFFFPNLLLAMLSPFVVKLEKLKMKNTGIGRISGNAFFWSTLGSIFGSLSSGFLLIPLFGLRQIIAGVGIILIVIGLLGLSVNKENRFSIKKLIIFASLSTGIFYSMLVAKNGSTPGKILYSKDGVYEKITIFDHEFNNKPTRFFKQDRSNSAAMHLKSSDMVFNYTKYYALYKIFNPHINHAFVIGGAAYTIPKAIIQDEPNCHVDVAEIEPSVFKLAKQYFNVPTMPGLQNHIEDGRRFLHDTDIKYDFIFSDAFFSLYSIPEQLTTREFYQLSKEKLKPDGVMIINVIGMLSLGKPSFLFSELKTFRLVFPNSYFFAVDSPKSLKPQNIIFVGVNGNKKIDFSDPEITNNSNPIIRNIKDKLINIDQIDLSPYPVLTDNYSPVEYLISKTLAAVE